MARAAGLPHSRPPLVRRLVLGDEAVGHHVHVAGEAGSVARLAPRPQSARAASPAACAGSGADGNFGKGQRRLSAPSGAQTSRPRMSGRAQSALQLPIAAIPATPRSSSGAQRCTGTRVAGGLTSLSSLTLSPGAAVASTRLAASAGKQRAGALGVRPATARAHGCKQHVEEQLLPSPAAAAGLKRPGTATAMSGPAAQTASVAASPKDTAVSGRVSSAASAASALQTAKLSEKPVGDWRKSAAFATEFKMDSPALVKTMSDPALSVSHRPPPVEQSPFHERLGNHLTPAHEKTGVCVCVCVCVRACVCVCVCV